MKTSHRFRRLNFIKNLFLKKGDGRVGAFVVILIFLASSFAHVNASSSVMLNYPLSANEDVWDYRVSADGETVVYVVRRANNDLIYKNFVAGGTPILLASLQSDGCRVVDFKISPDGNNVVVQEKNGDNQALYRLPMNEAGEITPLSNAGGKYIHFKWSPDGRYLVYRSSGPNGYPNFNLYHVDIPAAYQTSTPNPVRINQTSLTHQLQNQFEITGDSQHVIYVASVNSEGLSYIYRAPLNETTSDQGGDKMSSTNSYWIYFKLSPDGTQLVYDMKGGDDKYRIYSISTTATSNAGSAASHAVLLDTIDDYISWSYLRLQISQDNSRVFYVRDTNGWDLYSCGVDGTGKTKLNAQPLYLRNGSNYQIMPDAASIVLVARTTTDTGNRNDVKNLATTGNTDPTIISAYCNEFLLSSSGNKVISTPSNWVRAGSPTGEDAQIFTGNGQLANLIEINSENTRAIYTFQEESDTSPQLYCYSFLGRDIQKINGSFASNGSATQAKFSPNNQHVLYLAEQNTQGVKELFSRKLRSEWSPITRNPSALWDTYPGRWYGGQPTSTSDALISGEKTCVLSGINKTVSSLKIGRTADESGVDAFLRLAKKDGVSAELHITDDFHLNERGGIGGHGTIFLGTNDLLLNHGSLLKVRDGEELEVQAAEVVNSGTVEGDATDYANLAQLTFQPFFFNRANGQISLAYTEARFNGTLRNLGLIEASGFSSVYGDIHNEFGGTSTIRVKPDSKLTFYGKVTNDATIETEGDGEIVFYNHYEGAGISGDAGMVNFIGVVKPKTDTGSIAEMTIGHKAWLQSSSTVVMDIHGREPGQYDVFKTINVLTLGEGDLIVNLSSANYTPAAGDEFKLFESGSVQGHFNQVHLPDLSTGLFWHDDGVLGDGWDFSGKLAISIVPESYTEFATAHSLAGNAGDNANNDDDGDGVENLMEYVLGTNPQQKSTAAVQYKRIGEDGHFSITMPAPLGRDVRVEFQSSPDMQTWTTLSEKPPHWVWTGSKLPNTVNAGSGMKRYEFSVSAQDDDETHFYRIKTSLE